MDGDVLATRLDKTLEDYSEWREHTGPLPSPADLGIGRGVNAIDKTFSAGFLARMMFSCLVDADFLETERFYALSRKEEPPSRGGAIHQDHLDRVRARMARHRRNDTHVNRLRSTILDHANGKATLPPGLFTLTVPTGGGKTLTSLSFAMEYALHHGLRRIIYIVPFTGAWIETAGSAKHSLRPPVAPFAAEQGIISTGQGNQRPAEYTYRECAFANRRKECLPGLAYSFGHSRNPTVNAAPHTICRRDEDTDLSTLRWNRAYDVGFGKIVANEQQWTVSVTSQLVGKAVAKIEAGRMHAFTPFGISLSNAVCDR